MRTRLLITTLCLLLILPTAAAVAAIVLTPGDIGASFPNVMVHDRKGLLLPRNEAFVFSNTAIPYPDELVGATGLRVSFYFITETVVTGNVRMRCWLDSYGTGDPFNVGGYSGTSSAIPVGGALTDVYRQDFIFNTVPPPDELFALAVSRWTNNGDTYADAIYLHAIRFEVDDTSPVQDDVPAARDLGLSVEPNPFNPTTRILFDLPSPEMTTVTVYDLRGRLVQTLIDREMLTAGPQEVSWTPEGLPSGTYVIRVETAGLAETLKVGLIK